MKKAIVFLILILLISTFVSGRVIATFPELLNPDRMEMDENHIYITEGIAINIYSFKSFELIKKFGKKGEGPREFARYIGISLNSNKIYVNSQRKLSIYSVDGEFIKETKTNSSLTGGFIPLGKYFIGRGMEIGKEGNTSILINLYDSELKKQRNIIKKLNDNSFAKGVIKFFDSTLNYNVIGNKLYVVNGTDFKIDVYDSDAKKILSIQRDYKKIRFKEKDKKKFIDDLYNNPQTKSFADEIKKRAKFPEYYPAILNLYASGGLIYVMTYNWEGDNIEFLVFNTNGKFVKKVFIPFVMKSAFRAFPWSIKNKKLYQLIENDDEEWELIEVKINI